MKRLQFPAAAAAALVLIGLAGCNGSTKPSADQEIRVQTASFFPQEVEIHAGQKVLWVNVLRKAPENVRTVMSGTGPDDPDAGALFNHTLEGFGNGQATGESFTYTFTDVGDYPFFSQPPGGAVFRGTVTVR